MTAADATFSEHAVHEDSSAATRARRSARIRGVILAALGLFALQLAISTMEATAKFSFWIDKQGGTPFKMQTTVGLLWIVTGLVTGATACGQLYRGASFRWRRLLAVIFPLWVIATLAALLDGKPANLTSVLQGTLALATPITLGAFAGILSERSGLLNIAIEGKFLIGAASRPSRQRRELQLGDDPSRHARRRRVLGVAAAAGAASSSALLLAWLGIRWKVDQIIAGIVISIGAIGITNFLFLRVLSKNTELNTPPTIEAVKIPILGDIPVFGPILFHATPYVYFAFIVMIAFAYMLFRTRWGLRLRASGEKPSAAGTVGIDVIKIRYRAMILAGILAGIAGSSLSLASAGSFQMNMSAGRGFIALAAVIFGAWNPIVRVRCGPRLRLRRRGPVAALDPRRRRPAAAAQQRPVHRHDHRRGGRRRPGPRPRRRRPAVRPGLAGERGVQRRGVGHRSHAIPTYHKARGGGAHGALRDRRAPAAADHRQRPGPRRRAGDRPRGARARRSTCSPSRRSAATPTSRRCTENALRLLHAYGRDDVPVAEGAAGALLGRWCARPRSTARAGSARRSSIPRRRRPVPRARSRSSRGSSRSTPSRWRSRRSGR